MSELLELLVTEGPLKGGRYAPTADGLKLGRASSCDIAISDPALSRSHCLFELRDDAVWVTDLASANGTEVNGESVTERALAKGDRVTVGDSTLVLVAVGGMPVAEAAAAADVPAAVDLGFGSEEKAAEGATAARSNNLLRTALWGVCGVIVLGAAMFFLFAPAERVDSGLTPLSPVAGPADMKLVSLAYEKVEASDEGIFRYAMSVGVKKTEAGLKKMLTVTVDDVLTDNRHLEKDTELTPEKIAQLAKIIGSTGVTGLGPEYNGIAAKSNDLKSIRLKIVNGEEIFETSVENTTPPDELKNACAQLEAFSKNELGIWAIQYSSDKLTEMAESAMRSGDAKWEERDVQYGNIAEAIRFYREAVVDLETVNPKPDFHEELVQKLSEANDELDQRFKEQNFQCDRAIRLEDWTQARTELKILCEMVPDEQDQRHADAAAKLMDVEGRMKK